VALGFSIWLGPVSLASIQEVGEMLRAVKHAGPDAKEPNASGFTGAKEGDASNA